MSKTVFHDDEIGRCVVQEVDGFIFLHLELHKWGRDTLEFVRLKLDELLDKYAAEGHDVIFTLSASAQSVRFWKLVKPMFEIHHLEDGTWLGSWLTFEDNDGT